MDLTELLMLRAISGAGSNEPLIDISVSGNPVYFYSSAEKPLEKLEVSFSPIWEGSGTPYAPGCGKNLYDIDTYPLADGRYIGGANGNISTASGCACTRDYIPVSKYAGQTVTLNKRPVGNNPGLAFYTKSGDTYTYLSGEKNNDASAGTPWTFEIPATAEYMRFTVPSGATEVQIELGSTSSAYAPYGNIRNITAIQSLTASHGNGTDTPTDHTVQLGSSYLGGKLDLITGVLTVEWEFASARWGDIKVISSRSQTTGFYSGQIIFPYGPRQCVYDEHYGMAGTICNCIGNLIWDGQSRAPDHYYIPGASVSNKAYVYGDYDDDQIIQIAVKLNTPFTVQLTAQEINALKFDNVISANTNGIVNVTFKSPEGYAPSYSHENVKKMRFLGDPYAFGNAKYADRQDLIVGIDKSFNINTVAISTHGNIMILNGNRPSGGGDDGTPWTHNVDMPAGSYIFKVEPYVGQSTLTRGKNIHIDLWYDGNETSTKDKRVTLEGVKDVAVSQTFTIDQHVYKILVWVGVHNNNYIDYRLYYSLFPADVTITDVGETVPANGYLDVTFQQKKNIVNSMKHKCISIK